MLQLRAEMHSVTRILIAVSSIFWPVVANAAEIGRATIGGRTVIIDSNGTWAYSDLVQAEKVNAVSCTNGNIVKSKKLPISFCLEPPWALDSSPPGTVEFQVINRDLDMYFGLITERTQMEQAGLKQAILYNAATASNLPEQSIPIVKESKESINGIDWGYIEYDVSIAGGKFRFGNFYKSLGNRGVVQVAFWSNTTYFEENRPSMLEMITKVALVQ